MIKELILLPYAFLSIFFFDPVSVLSGCGVVKNKKVLAARAYHGILISFENETEEYFYRINKKGVKEKCRLFTDAFLKKYKGENNERNKQQETKR